MTLPIALRLRGPFLVPAMAAALLLPSGPAAALTLGQTDNFEDGTTQNWLAALLGAVHPAPPVNIASGGPAGADDNYLQLTAVDARGAGNRLTVINGVQWAGNYVAAGITKIRMDVRNLGATDLSLRLYFENPMGGPPDDEALSAAVLLPSGSGWKTIEFAVGPADLTLQGSGSIVDALTQTTAIRLFHGVAAKFPGETMPALLGVDNITAVPEPNPAALLALGLLALAWMGRQRPARHR